MRYIKQKVYKFNELSKEIKEKKIEAEKELLRDDYCEYMLKNDMDYEAEEILKRYFGDGANFKTTYYSLSYSQGDGAMIEFDIDIKDINKAVSEDLRLTNDEIDYLEGVGGTNIEVRHAGWYYHARCFDFNYSDYTWYDDDSCDWSSEQQNKLDAVMDAFRKLVIKANEELESKGWEFVGWEPSDKEAIEQLKQNEYFEDGSVYEYGTFI